jgi:CHC2 zinc finger/Domain of unknown function (DUF927)
MMDKPSIVGAIGQRVQMRRAGREYLGRCPFHEDKTPSLSVNDERGVFYCFGCGEGGDVFDFVMKLEGLDFPQAKASLGVNGDLPRPTKKDPMKEEAEHLAAWANRMTTKCNAMLRDVGQQIHFATALKDKDLYRAFLGEWTVLETLADDLQDATCVIELYRDRESIENLLADAIEEPLRFPALTPEYCSRVSEGAAIFGSLLRGNLLKAEAGGVMDAQTVYEELKKEEAANGNSAEAEQVDAYPYGVEDGHIVRYQTVKENTTISVPLCNFDAQIKEEIVLDDGAETHREFVIEGRLDTEAMLPEARVMVARFASMNWVGELGTARNRKCWQQHQGSLESCDSEALAQCPRPLRFTHTGWRKIGSQWKYLSGSTTGNSNCEVDLGAELARYQMPAVAGDPVGAMKLSLSLLKVAPLRITAPLFAACFRAPLCGAYPQDLSIWLEGRTGSMKSTLAALALNHFGEFDRVTLPGNWESTANHLERRAFVLKDSLFVIDEYVPTGLNRREIETKASRILRGQGHLSGRNRLKSDLTERPAFYPRGIIISTGEEHPPGQSLLARTIVIELSRDDVDIDLLTLLQQGAGRFAHAMAGYINWLAPQMDQLPALLKETFLGARAKATTGAEHLRIPEAAAHLWLGVHSALTYAQEIGAIGLDDAERSLDECWDAFIAIGKDQATLVEEEQPTRRFLGVLHTMVTQVRAIIKDKSEVIPDPKPGVDFVGWRDADYLYLLPDATFQAVARFCHNTGDHLPRAERLKRDLKKDGISECDADRLTRRVRIGNHLPRVLQLNIGAIEKAFGIEGWL